jgi:hypothetical protein
MKNRPIWSPWFPLTLPTTTTAYFLLKSFLGREKGRKKHLHEMQ